MAQTIRATYDGEVLRPEQPLDLEPNTTYLVTIRPLVPAESSPDENEEHPLTVIGRLAADAGVTDLAERHDYYAHGRIED
ncbi:MAG TPA: antitoxin family protein [Chloroflexota bacterium]|jgi:predicted DNA-binding antitoxin AbrB/MazE fold protein